MDAPRIGVVDQGTDKVWQYVTPLREAGATVEILDWRTRTDPASDAQSFDGYVLCGGDDIPGHHFGQDSHPAIELDDPRRDEYELAIARALLERRAPVLAVCRGLQVLAIAAGGDLHQHVPDLGLTVEHRGGGTHLVQLVAGSALAELAGALEVDVNTYHHQSVDSPGRDLTVVARSADGLVEAVEGPGRFCVGVQWHPEREGNGRGLGPELFRALIRSATPTGIPG